MTNLEPGMHVAAYSERGRRLTPWAVLQADWTVEWALAITEEPASRLVAWDGCCAYWDFPMVVPTYLRARKRMPVGPMPTVAPPIKEAS